MSTDIARCSRTLAVVVFGPPGRPPASVIQSRAASQIRKATVMVPEKLVLAWEGAYRKYGRATEMAARKPEADPVAAWEMASASLAVAKAWRDFTALPTLPWWVLAAVESAADAFEAQAQEWKALEDGEA